MKGSKKELLTLLAFTVKYVGEFEFEPGFLMHHCARIQFERANPGLFD